MKKLIKSAFALSLIMMLTPLCAQTEGIDDFLGLESEVMPVLEGKQRFTKDLHQKPDWKVVPEKVLIDSDPLKGQGYSIIPWKTLDAQKFLDINIWLREREFKDKTPDWQTRLREARQAELMGKLIKCQGTCQLHRGIIPVKALHLTRILEGDEISTDSHSTAWIYLMDGTLVRLSANSSLSFHEINLSSSQVVYTARLNQGHVFWHPRPRIDLPLDTAPETDADSIPLMIREANQQHFERNRFASQKDGDHLFEVMNLEENAVADQIQKINSLRAKNNQLMTARHQVMLVSPNATLVARDQSFDLLHVTGGKSYFKKRGQNSPEDFTLHLRGYAKEEVQTPTQEAWFEVDKDGRSFVLLDSVPGELQVTELITKRIKTLELARELWLEKYSLPIFASVSDSKKLAVEHGYRLWGEELNMRQDYLLEYTRRIETTNLRAKENLFARLESAGEKQVYELDASHYQQALNRYLKGLKSRYTSKKMQVREMSDLQYYVWILKNGKL